MDPVIFTRLSDMETRRFDGKQRRLWQWLYVRFHESPERRYLFHEFVARAQLNLKASPPRLRRLISRYLLAHSSCRPLAGDGESARLSLESQERAWRELYAAWLAEQNRSPLYTFWRTVGAWRDAILVGRLDAGDSRELRTRFATFAVAMRCEPGIVPPALRRPVRALEDAESNVSRMWHGVLQGGQTWREYHAAHDEVSRCWRQLFQAWKNVHRRSLPGLVIGFCRRMIRKWSRAGDQARGAGSAVNYALGSQNDRAFTTSG